MDTFMDKLAQKLTAQEIIKANTAAETEELNQLRQQLEEYRACMQSFQEIGKGLQRDQEQLEQLLQGSVATGVEQLVAEGMQKLEGAQVNGAEIDRLVQESIEKIQQLQRQAPDELLEMKKQLDELQAKLEQSNQMLAELGQKLEAQENPTAQLEAGLKTLDESVHKECVKVYRNVQAVVQEESEKQTEEIKKSITAQQGKVSAVLGVSIAALVAGIGSIVFQLLQYFQIL